MFAKEFEKIAISMGWLASRSRSGAGKRMMDLASKDPKQADRTAASLISAAGRHIKEMPKDALNLLAEKGVDAKFKDLSSAARKHMRKGQRHFNSIIPKG